MASSQIPRAVHNLTLLEFWQSCCLFSIIAGYYHACPTSRRAGIFCGYRIFVVDAPCDRTGDDALEE